MGLIQYCCCPAWKCPPHLEKGYISLYFLELIHTERLVRCLASTKCSKKIIHYFHADDQGGKGSERSRFLINVTQPVRGRTFQRGISFLPSHLALHSPPLPLLQPHQPLFHSLATSSLSWLWGLCITTPWKAVHKAAGSPSFGSYLL